MTIRASGRGSLWQLWDPQHGGFMTDGGEEGYILRTEKGWQRHGRGDMAKLIEVHSTLRDALRAAGVDQRDWPPMEPESDA